ncbi:hypothetical protein L596_004843 [Steinernema carpocapsae]|uniref:Uncharacterized protein n=1 Tax=Steinernema carpocapsae TaxID=34508 RepID=A0A4U8V187_STECR|nr:hypothetical protein L596_004843 [Steinernema carpocapsae]
MLSSPRSVQESPIKDRVKSCSSADTVTSLFSRNSLFEHFVLALVFALSVTIAAVAGRTVARIASRVYQERGHTYHALTGTYILCTSLCAPKPRKMKQCYPVNVRDAS